MLSILTRSKRQLQALCGYEARDHDFIASQPVGWMQNAIMRKHGVKNKQIIMHPLEWNGTRQIMFLFTLK
jgi:hypothetical protein